MASAEMVAQAPTAVLSFQVVQTDPLGNSWAIAGFDVEEDARAFAEMKAESADGAEFDVRRDPAWVAAAVSFGWAA